MNTKGNLTTGILIGVGISVAAYYLYMKNKGKVDEFLKSQGIQLPVAPGAKDYSSMSLEELVSTKEQIEDLIAEVEHKMKEQVKE
jgi:hypothetical protein